MKSKRIKTSEGCVCESGSIIHDWAEERLRVALVYPNTYYHGMSNLGFQTVYHLLNRRTDCLCERFFLPDDSSIKQLKSIESGRSLRDFDVVAFSVSFENDYLNIPKILSLGDVPMLSCARGDQDPVVVLGGVCAFINPEPLAPLVDVVAVGEAEPLLAGLVSVLNEKSFAKRDKLSRLSSYPGMYIPAFYSPEYDQDALFQAVKVNPDVPEKVSRVYLANLDDSDSRNFIQAEDTEFGSMALTEVSRGCSHGCRFCAAGFVYQPPRERSLDNLLSQVDAGLCNRKRIGLVAAAVADYSAIGALQEGILERGGEVSVASLRMDALTPKEIERLHASGHKTVAIAPEAGSQRMRDLINKGIDETVILRATRLLVEGGIVNLKLYFLIGLPGERDKDLEAVVVLTEKITEIWRTEGKARGRVGNVILSVNPFIPKPFTPLQWAAMDQEKTLKKKIRFLQSAISKIPNTKMNHESIRAAVLQAFLARGDRRIATLLPALAEGGNLKQIAKKFGLIVDDYVTRTRGEHEPFPWEIIDQGISRDYLWKEYQRAMEGQISPPCRPGCRRCGLCH